MQLPLATLITDRLAQLGINSHALAARLGYVNTNKGSRRIQALMTGQVAGQDERLSRLSIALDLPSAEVEYAVQATRDAVERCRREVLDAAEIRYRTSFVPHAVILTERRVPSQIAFCAFTQGERALHIDFDLQRPRASYAHQAKKEIDRRIDRSDREIAFFGPVRGFVVNYAWFRAVRFDIDGRALELLSSAVRIGESEVRFGKC